MIFRSVEARLKGGSFTVELNNSCEGRISLVDIILPCINVKDKSNNSIQIICDQLDSSFENPERLLKRIYFNKLNISNTSNFWEAKILDFRELNSSDNFLTFHIERLHGHPIKFHRNVGDHRVFLTLAFEERNEKIDTWTCV